MPAFDCAQLEPSDRALIAAALARDPALGEELELMAPQFGEAARRSFWVAFAAASRDRARPAAAALIALERAAGEGGRAGRGRA